MFDINSFMFYNLINCDYTNLAGGQTGFNREKPHGRNTTHNINIDPSISDS